MTGFSYQRPVTVALPDGWTFDRALDQLDVRSGHTGVTVLVYPALAAGSRPAQAALWTWLHTLPWLHLSRERAARWGGLPGRQVDVRPIAGAPVLHRGCRLWTPCVPLLTDTVVDNRGEPGQPTVELHPGVTSRLWLAEADIAPPVVFLWNIIDADVHRRLTDTQVLLRGLELGEATVSSEAPALAHRRACVGPRIGHC
jgi:hypothetical protein